MECLKCLKKRLVSDIYLFLKLYVVYVFIR